jgi:6-pyruvoyltetrahydropterin/6-carboxytetrahydropterin synthase
MSLAFTLFRRFEFSAAHQLSRPGSEGRLHGHNYAAWLGVTGPVTPDSGQITPAADLDAIVTSLKQRYDYCRLNQRLSAEPTALNLARAVWNEASPRMATPVQLASTEIQEEAGEAARFTPTEAAQMIYGEFAAAHRTHAPRLSNAENLKLYGKCNNPAGHGHNYQVELDLPPAAHLPPGLWAEFDHRNLSSDIPDLRGRNVVTETIAELLARRVPEARRVRVWETTDFFAEYHPHDLRRPYRLGRRWRFRAAHKLYQSILTPEENVRRYGACAATPEPHGHTYHLETTLAGTLAPETETVYDLGQLDQLGSDILQELDYTYLDGDEAVFTLENIARRLWQRFAERVGPALSAVRVGDGPQQYCMTQLNP